ncbi:hypothetical protein ACHBHM_06930 [Streptococcus sp. A18]|uniref:hypothetical protein n=1 Tax=Streptococcus sp. A18 TaxID=3373125 RepID=UPI00374D6D72
MSRKNETEYLVSDRFLMSRENRIRLIAKCKVIPDTIKQRKKEILEKYGLHNDKQDTRKDDSKSSAGFER